MADNSSQQGNDTIRDWDRSGIKTQVFAFDIAQSGEAELLGVGDSRNYLFLSAGLTTATTAYTAGDQLGTERSVAGIVRTGKGCILQNAIITDKAKVMGALDMYIYNAATTPAADNAANSWSDADAAKQLYIVHFTDVMQSANNYAIQATNLPCVLKPASGTTLYFDLVTRTANSFFGAVGDLVCQLGILRD